MNVKEIKKRIKEVRTELKSAVGLTAVLLEQELETLIYLMGVKRA